MPVATQTAAPTTAARASIDAMCPLTIDCRYDTSIDGMTRYQWPRIIAVQAPPSIAAEVRKLRTVSANTTGDEPAVVARDTSTPCIAMASSPATAAIARIAVLAG